MQEGSLDSEAEAQLILTVALLFPKPTLTVERAAPQRELPGPKEGAAPPHRAKAVGAPSTPSYPDAHSPISHCESEEEP